MPASNFKFVSPGVFVNEIDSSQLPRQAEEIGPVVIGRALKGPMMRPVKLESFSDFEQIFGLPVAGGVNNDVWREGNKLAPTYGAFAAEAYLKNAGPLTFVRLGGYQNEDATTGQAGWKTDNITLSTTNPATNGGAFGLFIAGVTGSDAAPELANDGVAKLAAVLYLDEGTVMLSGSAFSGSAGVKAAATWVKPVVSDSDQFTLVFSGSSGEQKKVVDFKDGSKLFIRNVLNTNPTKTNESLSSETEAYWLGQTFENQLPAKKNGYVATIVALASGSVSGGDFKRNAEKAKTPWIFAQHKGDKTEWIDSIVPAVSVPSQRLFRFEVLSEDEYIQNNVKISIEDIKLPASQYSKFGTFAVVVRSLQDTDDKRVVLERFDGCNLDASSPDYIGKKIGDRYVEWDYADRRFKEFGLYDNKSKYIRVEIDADVEAGVTDTDLLPFGYAGPLKYKAVSVNGDAGVPEAIDGVNSFLKTTFVGASNTAGLIGNYGYTGSLEAPGLPYVESTGSYHVKRIKDIYWGMKTTKGDTTKFNKEIGEYLRVLPTESSDVTEPAYIFSFDDISGSYDSVKKTYTAAVWDFGSRKSGNSLTANITTSDDWSKFLGTFNKFTLPLVGGFEGLDIKEKEPFNNRASADKGALDGKDELTSYAVNSLNVAIDMVSDPEVVEMNALVVPGIKDVAIHNKMISVCETRGDSLAIVDLKGDFTSPFEEKVTKEKQLPVVSEAVDYVKDTLTVNSSYGCSYFPWVLVNDVHSGNKVYMPPSVVALGTFGSTKRFSEIWFAPAGFTRGGLSDAQAGGLPVVGISKQLNSKDRDALYEAGINPIAKFPHEGIVIFGQKTLQATPSALDRVNVRRLMNYVKKEISKMASTVLFDPNVEVTWERFLSQAEPFLASVKSRLGLTDFRVVLDETTTTPDLVDRNIVYAKILLKPARAIEYIALDFNITNSGASFND